jgi:MinD superfamily P-loop ATPase
MKQLLILSGKGGTGKTTVASAFIKLSEAKAFADCDVDAPNLHLIKRNFDSETKLDYFGMDKARINPITCLGCGVCAQICRFDAIMSNPLYKVDPLSCEGCGVCERVCPNGSISMRSVQAGEMKIMRGEAVFSTAKLHMGHGTSGMLVSEVKKNLVDAAEGVDMAIIDGSPGIGCPVISSISGVDMVLVVAEPSVSGISDLKRILDTAKIFRPSVAVCINKYDTNIELTGKIEKYCEEHGVSFLGKIPYDQMVVSATNSGVSIVDIDSSATVAIKQIYKQAMDQLSAMIKNKIQIGGIYENSSGM